MGVLDFSSGAALVDELRRSLKALPGFCLPLLDTIPGLKAVLTRAFRPGKLVVLSGASGRAKSTFALRSLISWTESGAVVLYYSCSGSPVDTLYQLGEMAGLNADRLERGSRTELDRFQEWLDAHPLLHVASHQNGDLTGIIAAIRLEFPAKPFIVVADSIQTIPLIEGELSPQQAAGAVALELKRIAHDHDCLVIAISDIRDLTFNCWNAMIDFRVCDDDGNSRVLASVASWDHRSPRGLVQAYENLIFNWYNGTVRAETQDEALRRRTRIREE